MIHFDSGYFNKFTFTTEQIGHYFASAKRDIGIASKSDVPEVIFKFTYDALIKLGIALIAKHGYKVTSKTGHHVKILEKLAKIIDDENIDILGNQMRQTRNVDLYDGGALITEKDAVEYFNFVDKIIKSTLP